MSTPGTPEQEREHEEHGPHKKSHLFLWLAVPKRDILMQTTRQMAYEPVHSSHMVAVARTPQP